MKMKVLPSYLILLSFYVILAAKLPDKISSASVQQPSVQQSKTPTKRAQKSNQRRTATTLQNASPTAITTTTYIPIKRTTTSSPTIVTKAPTKITTTPRKASPKKYIPTTQKTSTSGPLKISLSKSLALPTTHNERNNEDPRELICPTEGEANFELFAPSCRTDRDCTAWNRNERCCKLFGSRNCIKGVPKPLEEQDHVPLLGLIPRKCPQRPLAELWWELKTCDTDMDCWPRICCPDGQRKYCRTSAPEYEAVPPPIGRSIAYLSEYLECTPPPPPVFDLHPKSCNSTLECFPNICCQESGKKICRPPKKSVLTIMANFLNIGLVKRLTRNLVIK